jgi:hypothetical protein
MDRFGEPGAELALASRLRAELDPAGVLARGRTHGGL